MRKYYTPAEKRARRAARAEKRRLETPEQKEARIAKNKKARARHWLKTGVRQETVDWMDRYNFL